MQTGSEGRYRIWKNKNIKKDGNQYSTQVTLRTFPL